MFLRLPFCFMNLIHLIPVALVASFANAVDWPMYRHDSGRRAVTTEILPNDLTLAWSRELVPVRPAFRDSRLHFDAGYEPIISNDTLLIGSSQTDSVSAYDAVSGREKWVFYTNGPVRLAPAISGQLACFGSDDGCMYCVDLATGKLQWKHQAVPSDRKLLGNRRLISVWPIRGGPVVADGVVYFAAGVWPFEGVFVYAMEIETGRVLWRNDRLGYRFGQQPHNTKAIGGLAPQGYLLIDGEDVIVPCSNAYPARLSRRTGELVSFELPKAGRYPGGWFAALDPDQARALRRGQLTYDDAVNQHEHEDGARTSNGGIAGISREIRAGDKTYRFDEKQHGIDGVIHSMVVANQSLFVTTREGELLCYRGTNNDVSTNPEKWHREIRPLSSSPSAEMLCENMVKLASSDHGIAVIVGLHDGEVIRALIETSNYQVIAFDDDQQRIDGLRSQLNQAGIDGDRAAIINANLRQLELPPYVTTLLTSERFDFALTPYLQTLRPYGGIAVSGVPFKNEAFSNLQPGNFKSVDNVIPERSIVQRTGRLPGTDSYVGGFATSQDELVKFPLGVLWFDDELAHFKRSPQPVFDRATMISRPKNWHAPRHKGNYKIDYPLLPIVLSDIYTGRVLEPEERLDLRESLGGAPTEKLEPSQYRPSGAPFSSKSTPRVVGQRINPLTGLMEARAFPKTYGCDGGIDYGNLYTLRSGTAAFYDKSIESGTVFLSGPRSGCTNSIIPSGGVLNVPYFYEGCTCSYPLPTAMSLVAMPQRHEQWSSWGECEIQPGTLQRLGINFGAPGDRMTREGTLWLDYPSVGGPSPMIRIETNSDIQYHYQHSLWMQQDDVHPWVSGSFALGLQSLVIRDMKPGNYQVRIYFAEPQLPESPASTDRIQKIKLQGQDVAENYNAYVKAGQPNKGTVWVENNVLIRDKFTLQLSAVKRTTLISGIELIRQEN